MYLYTRMRKPTCVLKAKMFYDSQINTLRVVNQAAGAQWCMHFAIISLYSDVNLFQEKNIYTSTYLVERLGLTLQSEMQKRFDD